MNDPFLNELSDIHTDIKDLIQGRKIPELIAKLEEIYDCYPNDPVERVNCIKTAMVITKNVPMFIPEIAEIRAKMVARYNEIIATLK